MLRQWFKDVVHNCLVHPILPFVPVQVANWLHDVNADWAFGRERFDELKIEARMRDMGMGR